MGTNIFRFESDLEILLFPTFILLSSCFQSDTVIFFCVCWALHPSTISDVSFASPEYNLHLLPYTSRSSEKKTSKGQDQKAKNIFQYNPISYFKPRVHCKSLFKRRQKKMSGRQIMPWRGPNQNLVPKQKGQTEKRVKEKGSKHQVEDFRKSWCQTLMSLLN